MISSAIGQEPGVIMATIAGKFVDGDRARDALSGTPRAHAVDGWIYVFMAAWFIVIVLVEFIPDAMMKVALVKAGARPPFPLILHVHALLMGSFLLLLLAQTWLMATGRKALHMQLGVLGIVLAAALVVAGIVLAPTMYYQVWGGATFGPPAVRAALAPVLPMVENICCCKWRRGSCSQCSSRSRSPRGRETPACTKKW